MMGVCLVPLESPWGINVHYAQQRYHAIWTDKAENIEFKKKLVKKKKLSTT